MSTSRSSKILLEEIDCPLCGATENRVVVETCDHQWGASGEFAVVQCSECAHRFMNPRPTLASLGNCYPAHYGPHQLRPELKDSAADVLGQNVDAGVSANVKPWYLRYLPLRHVPGLRQFYYWLTDDRSQVIPDLHSGNAAGEANRSPRVFELGCAAGAYLAKLQTRGWEAFGVEPGDGPVRIAQAAGLSVHHGTLDDADVESESFDFAASWMVIEHVPDPRQTLTQLYRLLKPGGSLALSVPNAGCWEPRFFGRYWDAWDLPRHLHHFSPSTIRRLLLECGFEDISVTHQRTLLNIFGSIGILLTARRPSSRLGNWLLRYPHSPQLAVQLMAAPLAHALAFFRQGGRLTITATRPREVSDASG